MDGGPPTEADRVKAGERSVLDVVQRQYETYLPRVAAEDRSKLESHRDLIVNLKARLGGTSMLSCGNVPPPDSPDFDGPTPTPAEWERKANAYIPLVGAALKCDLTRVISLTVEQLPNQLVGADSAIDLHTVVIHNQEATPENQDIMLRYHQWQARYFVRLLDELASIPDADGSSLLDNTLVLWCGELATGEHLMQNWPVVMAGGGAAFRMGRYVYRPRTTPKPWGGALNFLPPGPISTPHNHLLVSIARAFGIDTDSFGITSYGGEMGATISTTGPLEGLT
jgi:hypothetical protein